MKQKIMKTIIKQLDKKYNNDQNVQPVPVQHVHHGKYTKEQHRAWCERNPVKCKEQRREWCNRNPEKCREQHQEWCNRNPEKCSQHHHN